MKKVNKDVLKDASNRLLFTMSDEEFDLLLDEFEILTKQFDLIGDIEGVDDETPMTFPYEVYQYTLREDIPTKPLGRDEVLKNAGSVQDGQIKLPKVI
ncbi:MAG TPA: hypothetical protein DEA28_04150 [Firmicutes bacterium]|nr:hypothetical protein [Clostridiales bacterium]HBS10880.1 hypothetical protein [Bacillota bacterium]